MSFGIALSVKSRVRECTPALFNQMVDNEKTARVCAEIEDALEKVKRGEMSREDFEEYKGEQKKRLAIFTPHATFPKGRRVNEDAVPSGLSMYDVDHISPLQTSLQGGGLQKASLYERLVEHTLKRKPITDDSLIGELKRLGILMLHVTPSLEGLRLFFVMPEGMSLEEAQRWMSEQLGDDHYDGCVKDLARCSFAVPRAYILYLDENELFEDRSVKVEVRNDASQVEVGRMKDEEKAKSDDEEKPSSKLSKALLSDYKDIPYSDIIEEWWKRHEGKPQRGNRNNSLFLLAVNLRAVCENRNDHLIDVLPRYTLSKNEHKSIVTSASKGESSFTLAMKSVLDDLKLYNEIDEEADNTNTLPISMKRYLPVGLKESLIGVPANMQMPVLCAVMPIAATYADLVSIKYCDGMEQKLGLMSIILGDQASGKSVCKNAVDIWKRQLDEDDALARKREEEWKERKKARKANEKAPEDPKVLIRVLPVTVSCSTLLKRFKNSNGHTLYSFGEELDTLRKTNGAGSWSSKYDIYRLSFDRGEWGQDYNSDQAESGVVRVAYNWTMLGTYGAMRKCFKSDNIENGLSSRILVAEMPDSSFAKMPKYGKRTSEDEARILEAVNVLRKANGLIDTPRLRKAIEQWVEEKRVEAAKDIDRVKDTYRKRAAVIGFRCGVIFHLLTGKERETQPCIDFAVMMAEYCLTQHIKAFGDTLMNQYINAADNVKRMGANMSIFDKLAPVFTIEDILALKGEKCTINAIRVIIHRWLRDGWIVKTENNLWKKKKVNNKIT